VRTTPTKWDLKREASRAALVESAMRNFAEHGYAATRVEDIVEGTGYTKGAFYFHFENKLECFWSTIAHREALRGDWVSDLLGQLPAGETLEQVLARMFRHFAGSEQGVGAWILVMVDFHQQHKDDAEIAARLAEVYATWHENLGRFMAALQERHLVREDKDAALLAAEAFAYVEGLTAHGRMYCLPDALLRTALFDGLVALLGRGDEPAQPRRR
jgi:AcrR family transcriptional regulator